MKRRKWTKEEWDEAVQFYGNASAMKKENSSLFRYGCKRGWTKDTVWPNCKRRSYTRKEWDEAVRLHGNPGNMIKHDKALYCYGRRRGWHKTTVWPNRKKRIGYTEEQLRKEVFAAARRFHSRGEFIKNDYANYEIALKRGWLDEMYWLKPQENPYKDRINYIYLYLFEQQNAFYVGETYHGSDRHLRHRTESSSAVFKFAKENGIEIPEPIILEDGLERDNEVRRQEHYWKLHYISLGYDTLNKGKTGEFCGSLGSRRVMWTREKCREKALLCKSSSEMKRRFPGAYYAAMRNGWLNDYTWFVVVSGKPKPVLQYTKDGTLVGRWDSISSAESGVCGARSSGICMCCRGKAKSYLGYVWKYADAS